MTTDLETVRLAFRGLSDEEDEESALSVGGEEFEPDAAKDLEELDEFAEE